MMECPLCDTKMREYNDRYECKTHHIIYWKNHSREGRPANLFKKHPIHPMVRFLTDIFEFITQPYILIFLVMSLTFALATFWIGVTLATANYYHP